MDFTPVQTSIEQDINAALEERDEQIELLHRAAVARRFRFGALSYAEYKSLTENQQRVYNRIHGRPTTPAEAQATSKKQSKKTKARKAEKQARKTARRK